MAAKFYPLKIKALKRETANCVSVSFVIPPDLREIFSYKEGQNITIRKNLHGQELRRSYSICNAPHENELKIAIKKVEKGLFSTFANNEIQAGDELEVMPPTGRFTSRGTTGNYLGIAAGSGITPVISIVKHILKTQADSSFTLIYGNQKRNSIIFFEEIEALKNKYMERFVCVNILSRERTDADINYGRIDTTKFEVLKQLINFKNITNAFLCGPEAMILSASAFLEKEGLAKANIHFELFATSVKKYEAAGDKIQAATAGLSSNITVKVDGRSFQFSLPYKSDNILDAALAQGADLPYACKGGVCCTCRAKLVEGKVQMDVNYALEEEEVAHGFILCCQSHPVSENVVIDFDIK